MVASIPRCDTGIIGDAGRVARVGCYLTGPKIHEFPGIRLSRIQEHIYPIVVGVADLVRQICCFGRVIGGALVKVDAGIMRANSKRSGGVT